MTSQLQSQNSAMFLSLYIVGPQPVGGIHYWIPKGGKNIGAESRYSNPVQ